MAVTLAHDAIHANIGHLPPGQAAGYTTGSPAIRWTAADWKSRPGAVRICQDSGSDHTADVLDVESGAATNAEAAPWFKAAAAAYHAGTRPGQRSPAVYTSASNVTPLVNALVAAGVKSGCGLWVANWNLGEGSAEGDIEHAAGPFPVIGVQYASNAFYDSDVFSRTWLHTVSAKPGPAGPFRHATASMTTFGALAASRNATMEGFTGRAFKGYTAADWDALEHVNAGAGFIYYTQSP